MQHALIDKESQRWHYLTVLIILLSSYLILSDLQYESIWLDEGYTYAVSHLPLNKLIVPFDVHPPLFYIIESFFVKDDGDEKWLRLPAALAGIATVILVYIASNKLFGARGGFASTMFIGLSFAHIAYSSNARNYTLLLLLFFTACICLALLYHYSINDTWHQHRSNLILSVYFLSSVACLYTHNISVIYLAVLNIVVLIFSARHRRELKRIYITGYIALNIAIFICWLPWLSVLTGTTDDFDWLTQPSISLAVKQFLALIRPNHTPLAIPYLSILAITYIYALIKSDDSLRIILLTTIIGIPLVVFGVGYIKPLYMERTILPILLGFSLCLGFLASNSPSKAMIVIGFFTVSSAIFAFDYHNRVPTEETIAGKLSQDWRSAVRSGDENEAFIADHFSIPIISFYRKNEQRMYFYDNGEVFPVTMEKWNEYFTQPVKYRHKGNISFTEFLRMNEGNEMNNRQFLRNKTISLIDIKIVHQSNVKIQDFLIRNGYKLKETIDLVGLTLYRYIKQ